MDIDPQALAAVRKNVLINDLGNEITVLAPDQGSLPPADLIIANILLKPLLELVELFAALVKEEGNIVLSGLLSTQAQECLEAYGSWFKMETPLYREEWALLHGRR